ncbi:hypothetical protein SDC9_143268 [bioreactor metagenome]|uniref:Uncharacterized protein n=1 Tax=bioreactor metagenome TaxID=1076179 RepID=A0A645E3H5_9ZZZZ
MYYYTPFLLHLPGSSIALMIYISNNHFIPGLKISGYSRSKVEIYCCRIGTKGNLIPRTSNKICKSFSGFQKHIICLNAGGKNSVNIAIMPCEIIYYLVDDPLGYLCASWPIQICGRVSVYLSFHSRKLFSHSFNIVFHRKSP